MSAIRITFGKHKGHTLAEIPLPYLHWLIHRCHSLDPALGQAVRLEINRREEAPDRMQVYMQILKTDNPNAGDREAIGPMIIGTVKTLLKGEETGQFAKGQHLDQLWLWIAQTHNELKAALNRAERQNDLRRAAAATAN